MNKTLSLLDDYLNGKIKKTFDVGVSHRKVVIWYDKNKEYYDFVNSMIDGTCEEELTDKIKSAKFYIYDKNSIEIRYKLEYEDTESDVIIYVPFDRPDPKTNDFLLDIESFNFDYIFIPDNTTIRLNEYGLDMNCKDVLDEYKAFFKDKKREAKFRAKINDDFNKNDIERLIISILLGVENTTDDNILKNLIYDYYEDEDKFKNTIKQATKFVKNLLKEYLNIDIEDFDNIENEFYKLVFTHFVKDIKIDDDTKKVIERYGVFYNHEASTNSYILINSIMKDKDMTTVYNNLSELAYEKIGVEEIIKAIPLSNIVNSDTFKTIDILFIKDIVNKLSSLQYDYKEILDVINTRKKKYWYNEYYSEDYKVLEYSLEFLKKIVKTSEISSIKDINEFINKYKDTYSDIDTLYRKIHIALDLVENKDLYEKLIEIINNKYDLDFVQILQEKWYNILSKNQEYFNSEFNNQTEFYNKYIDEYKDKKERVFVIISDAFRYECGKELFLELNKFATKCEIESLLCTVPSYTKLGMASLLPHDKLKKADNNEDILVNDVSSASIKDRDNILKNKLDMSLAIKYEDLVDKNKSDWKKDLAGYKVIYIYHNVIDKVGESNDKDVFNATAKAIKEIKKFIIDLHTTFSSISLYVTADHGYFYQRKKVEDYMKTDKVADTTLSKHRYSYSKEKTSDTGILSFDLKYLFGDDAGYVNIPKGYNQFYKKGGYDSYIHGGALPQELILPLIFVKTKREDSKGDNRQGKKVSINYSGITRKITNAITYLEFIQENAVSEDFRECRYLLHFEDDNGNLISDETTIVANLDSKDIKDRYFKEKFVFKNIKYNKDLKYKLVIIDEETKIQIKVIDFVVDITIVNNFDF